MLSAVQSIMLSMTLLLSFIKIAAADAPSSLYWMPQQSTYNGVNFNSDGSIGDGDNKAWGKLFQRLDADGYLRDRNDYFILTNAAPRKDRTFEETELRSTLISEGGRVCLVFMTPYEGYILDQAIISGSGEDAPRFRKLDSRNFELCASVINPTESASGDAEVSFGMQITALGYTPRKGSSENYMHGAKIMTANIHPLDLDYSTGDELVNKKGTFGGIIKAGVNTLNLSLKAFVPQVTLDNYSFLRSEAGQKFHFYLNDQQAVDTQYLGEPADLQFEYADSKNPENILHEYSLEAKVTGERVSVYFGFPDLKAPNVVFTSFKKMGIRACKFGGHIEDATEILNFAVVVCPDGANGTCENDEYPVKLKKRGNKKRMIFSGVVRNPRMNYGGPWVKYDANDLFMNGFEASLRKKIKKCFKGR